MQTPQQRDEKTVVIATALGLFCVVMLIGALGIPLLSLNDSTVSSAGAGIAGGLVSIAYLAHARRK